MPQATYLNFERYSYGSRSGSAHLLSKDLGKPQLIGGESSAFSMSQTSILTIPRSDLFSATLQSCTHSREEHSGSASRLEHAATIDDSWCAIRVDESSVTPLSAESDTRGAPKGFTSEG